MLHAIIKRPGLLVDDHDAAALLGLDSTSFDALVPKLLEAGLGYTGVFSDGWRRWWASRIEDWGEGMLGSSLMDLTAKQRAEALSAGVNPTLAPARSPWNDSPDEFVSFACCCCRRATELRHSMAIFRSKGTSLCYAAARLLGLYSN